MRWLADECVAASLVRVLRGEGHDVVHIAEFAPSSADEDVLDWAQRENRLLLTEDKDFGDLIFAKHKTAVPGVILIRIPDERASLVWPRLQAAIERFHLDLYGRYIVIEEARFRVKLIARLV